MIVEGSSHHDDLPATELPSRTSPRGMVHCPCCPLSSPTKAGFHAWTVAHDCEMSRTALPSWMRVDKSAMKYSTFSIDATSVISVYELTPDTLQGAHASTSSNTSTSNLPSKSLPENLLMPGSLVIQDNLLAVSILRSAALCPQLKTCTIIFPEPSVRRIGSCLAAGTQTAMVIDRLNIRSISERLEVTTELSFLPTQPISINDLLLSIALASNWSCNLLKGCHTVDIQARWNLVQYACKLSRPEMLGYPSENSIRFVD